MVRLKMETDDSVMSVCDPMDTDIFSLKNGGDADFAQKDALKSMRENSLLEMGKQLLDRSKEGDVEGVKDLISLGAPFATDWLGTSPLHLAAYHNHPKTAEVLILSGIPRDAKNKADRTPLHVAAERGNFVVVEVLLEYGCYVNQKDMLKMTPLHWAAQNGCLKCIKLLLDYGADVCAINKFDKTPSMLALENSHTDTYILIEEALRTPVSARANKVEELLKKSKANLPVEFRANPTLQCKQPLKKDDSLDDGEDTKCKNKKVELVWLKSDSSVSSKEEEETSLSCNQAVIVSDSGRVLLRAPALLPDPPDDEAEKGTALKPTVDQTPPTFEPSSTPPTPNKLITINSTKKIITIKAEELINMTKEKKVVIKHSHTIPKVRMFEGKLYTLDQKDTLLGKVQERLDQSKKDTESLRQQLEKKEKETDSYIKQIDAIKAWCQ